MSDVGNLVVKVAMDNSNFQQGVQNLNRSMKVIQSEFKNATSGLKEHGKGLEGLKAKQEMLSKSIDVQSKIVQKYKDKLKESKETLNKNAEAQAKLKDKVEDSKKAYEESKATLGENNTKTKELKKAYEDLSTEYTKNEDKLRNNVRTVDNYTTKVNNAESKLKGMKQSLNSVSSSIQQQESKWNKLSQKLDFIGKKFEAVGKKMSSMGKGLTAKLTGPIAAIGIAASKVGMDFEASMSNVSALSGATGDSLKQLENKAREMGANTSKSAKDAADGMGFLALSGMKNKEMLEAIEPVLRLSEAGNLDLARASNLTTNALSALNLKVKDLPHFLDVVAQSARSSNTNIDQMAEAYITCGGTLKGLNVPLEESAVILGMFANKGVTAGEAGTALNAIITNLTAPTGRAEKALKALKITAFDSHGKFKGLSNVLFEVKNKTKNMTEENRNMYLSMIGGKEHIKDLNALLNGLGTDYTKLKGDIASSNGALNDMAKTMQDNNKGSITSLKSALEELCIKIYNVLKPAIASIVDTLREWTKKLNSLTPVQQQLIVKIAGMVAAIGPLLLVGGKIASGIVKIYTLFSTVSGAIAVVTTGAAAATPAIGALATAFTVLTGPVGIAIAAIGAIGIAVYECVKHFDKLKEKFKSLSTLGKVISTLVVVANPALAAIAGLTLAIKGIKTATEPCVKEVDLFANKVETTANKVKNANGTITNSYSQTTIKISEATKKAVGSYLELDNKASKALINLNANSKNLTSSAKNTVIKNFSDMVNKSSGKGKELNSKMIKEFSNLVQNTGTLTETNKKAIVSKYTSMVLDCNKLTSKQKVDTVNKFKEILKETTGITKQQKDNLVAQYNQMGAQINAGYDKHYQERTAKLQKFFSTNTNLTVQEQQEILAKEKSHNEQMKASTNEYTEKIKSIFERASKEHRQLKADEVKDIKMYQDNMKENAIKTLSANEVESKVILERIKSYSTSITTEQAAEVIKNAETQRVKSVDEANKQFIETTNNIKEMRDKTGSITAEQAQKMIADAKQQRDETVKQANQQKQEVVKQISEQNSDIIKNIDTSNGQIKTKWQVLKEDVSRKAHELKETVVRSFEEKKAEITKKCSEIKTSIVNKWNEILNWFSTLPARLKQKGSEMFESMKQGIDNKLTNIKTSCKNIGTSILNAFRDIPKQALEIGGHIIDGLWHGITSGAGKVVDAAKNLGNSITNKIKETLDIHSPSRVMEELGLFTDLGLANGVKNNAYLVEKEAQNLANSVLKEVSKISSSNVDLKVNVSAKDIENNTRHILNWGEKNKKTYKEFIDFVNKLNTTEVNNSKELLEKDYKNRVKSIEDKLRVVKTNSVKELQIKKDNIDKQIAEYQRLIRNTKSKDNRKNYADKIANLKAYQTKVVDYFKSTQQAEINNIEVSKRALKDYYTLANNLLNKRSQTVKDSLKTTENVFKDKLNNFSVAIKKLSIDTDNLNSKLKHQKAIVIIQAQKINALKVRYEELCNTLGATHEKTIEMKKAFEDANNEMTNMAKNVESTNAEMRDKAVQDVDRLNSFIIKALERKVKAEEKAALETAKIKAKEHNMSKEQLEKFLNYVKNIYEKKLNQDVLQGQAEQLIMSKNQKAIVNLLNSYGNLYQDAGISLGQKLVMGTKSWTDVLPPIISNTMQNVVGTVGQASNSIGQSLSNVMEQIADVAKAGQELANACAGTDGKISFDFDFNFDSVYKDWESSIDNVETKSENVAEKISNKYKEAFNRIELAQIELNRSTKNSDEELKKQQDLLDTQKDKLDTLKNKYTEMRSALGDSDDEVIQLKKDIASLTVEIENNTNNLAINKIKESYKQYADVISKEDKELSLKEIKNAKDREDVEKELFLNKFSNLEALKDTYRELKEVLGENADEVKQLENKILDAKNDLKEVGNTTAKNIINSTFQNALEEIEQEEIKLNRETGNVNSEFERQDKIIENKAKKLEVLKQKFNEFKNDGYVGENDEATISTKKDILNLEIEIANSRLKLQKDIDAKARADADAAAQRSKQAFDDYINSIKNKYTRLQEELEIATVNLSRETFNADSALEVQKSLLDKQKTTLKYLKEEYRELSTALGSTSQDAIDLQKSIASLNIEIENHTKAIDAQAIRNKYQSIVNALELDTLKLTKTTKNYNEELDQQCDIYVNMILKLDSMGEAYKNLSKILGEDADEVQSLQKEIITYNKELDKFCKDCNNKLIDNINKFNSKIKEALKERYTKELKIEEDKISKELNNLNKWKDESIKRIEDVYNAKIKSLDDELKAEDKFEKDREELKKIHQLQDALKFEHNEFNKVEIQKELNRAIADRNKRLHREDIENKKAKLQEDKKNEINNLNNLYESNKANLEKQLEDTKNYYKDKLKLANLEAESQKLIVDNNQKEIVELIKSYDKDYEQAGKTLGQRLAEGMTEKISPVLDLIDNMQTKIKDLRTQEIQASINTAKYSPISSVGNGSINSTTNNSSNTIVNNNNITFNSPKQLTPSEIRRETETTLRNLAFGM